MLKLGLDPNRTTTPRAPRAARPTVLVAHPGAELYGSDRMMLESVSAMVEAGWDVVVTLPGHGPLAAAVRARGGRVVQTPTPVLRKSALRPAGLASLAAETARSIPAAVRLLRSVRPDAVYVSTVTIPLWIPVAKALGVPVVTHVHEAESSAPTVVRRALAAPLLLADGVVVNSRFTQTVLTTSLPSVSRSTSVVLNGVEDAGTARPARDELRGPVELTYVGRLSLRKGVDLAVEALALLVDGGLDARLTLVGSVVDGQESVASDLRTRAERRGVLDRVTFLGFQADVWEHSSAADIILVPSRLDESFGNTAVEGVLAARPVVVGGVPGLREAVDGYLSAQTVQPDSATAIADAVRHVVANWAQYRSWAQQDAVIAADRHALWRYRDQVAAAMSAVAPALAAAPVAQVSLRAPAAIDVAALEREPATHPSARRTVIDLG